VLPGRVKPIATPLALKRSSNYLNLGSGVPELSISLKN